ncbi:UNVERIFIED_CONTAM: Beta-taxilin [Sesamum radiatum]|uniref:Beta-taxilin n=1 Tax=Sesamum radiatum TaxID=300843 RepID=A0AAW2K848_SESRA
MQVKMENPNPEVNQLPEADSLPDGFVESSSAEPLKEAVTDYKEEKLLEPDSLPEVVIGDGGSSASKIVENAGDRSQSTAMANVAAAPGEGHVKGKSTEGVELQTVSLGRFQGLEVLKTTKSLKQSQYRMKFFYAAQFVKTKYFMLFMGNVFSQEAPEVKRKNVKRTFKSEKEFLEFTLKYQQVIAERDSAVAVRDKLESLCRELQRQNKLLMDECKRVSTEGQNLRLDLSNKFQDAIKEVSSKLEEQKDECISQLKENEMLKTKLKQLVDQYALSEQQHAQQTLTFYQFGFAAEQKTLELQLADLKLQQHEEKLKQEQSQMKLYAEQVAQLLATEKNLRLQLTADGEKFQQFQEALLKSNEVFETFKQEIEKVQSDNA